MSSDKKDKKRTKNKKKTKRNKKGQSWGLQFKLFQSKKPIRIDTIFIPKKGK